ncbi:hypothetical protein SDC9_170769 [bioreactor metagenome]|uniref:Uncharacterized protein n=1 Tax=bioreactor metagenome TaxID=1076179 RepID=A0A645G8Y9_9ZZZZ
MDLHLHIGLVEDGHVNVDILAAGRNMVRAYLVSVFIGQHDFLAYAEIFRFILGYLNIGHRRNDIVELPLRTSDRNALGLFGVISHHGRFGDASRNREIDRQGFALNLIDVDGESAWPLLHDADPGVV